MYNEALKQWWKMILRFLPNIFKRRTPFEKRSRYSRR